MNFETVGYNDLNEIRNLQPAGWPDIVPEFEFYIDSKYCHPILTRADTKIVGIGALIIFDKTCWMAHVIVDEVYRKRGVGYKIVEELLDQLHNYSIDTCLLIATELGKPTYQKVGFRIVSEYYYLNREKQWPNFTIPKNVTSFKEDYYSMIICLDKKISGENREALLSEHIKNSTVYIEDNIIKGYYLPGLEEGLILADTIEAGIELMKVKYSKIDKAVIPSENTAGIEFLKQNGFVEIRTKGTRMILGKDIDWKPEKIFSRIGGNFG
jgi:N-acetylglutamate synthase-like GNAT family acetyltransferase